MFSKGQLYFSIFFIIVFGIGMVWSYKKDKKHQEYHYKGILKVALVVVLIIISFATLTFWIHE